MENPEQKKDRQKALIGTVIFHTALLLAFIFLGLSYYEPKPEDGIVINFGNSQTGLGDQADGAQTSETQPTPSEPVPEDVPVDNVSENDVATQDVVDAPTIEKKPSKPKTTEKPKPKEPEKPKPSDALQDLLKATENSKTGGEGDAGGSGDQGDPSGDPNSPSRTGGATGGGGAGGSGNYLLGGRAATSRPKPDYPCEAQGRVVVKIYVDRNGRVTQAIAGEKIPNGAASTTADGCLYSQAEKAARATTWSPDGDAPATQIGYIIYNFRKN